MVCAVFATPASAYAYLYWTDGTNIGRAIDDGSSATSNLTAAASGFDVAVSSHIYWGGQANGVGRANLDGTNSSILHAVNSAWGIDVDANYIYYANQGQAQIQRIDRGTGLNQTNLAGSGNPRGVAVNATHLYWTDLIGGTIGRANLDGSAANVNFINVAAPNPTAVAVSATHVYWATRELGTIGRANLDGTGVNDSFITGAGFTRGVAADATYLYWGTGGSIGRANLDGTNVNHTFLTTPGIIGVDVHPDTAPPVTTDDVPTTWQAGPFRVTLTGTDDSGSGFKSTYYELGANPTTPTTASAVYDAANKPALGNGEMIRYFSTDESGNAEQVRSSATARVDTQAPTTTDDVPTTDQTSRVTVTLTATDGAGSGVNRTYYTTGTNPSDPTTSSAVYDAAAKPTLGRGELIKYFSTDMVGHAEAIKSSAVVSYAQLVISSATASGRCISSAVRDIGFRYRLSSAARVTYTLERRTNPRLRVPFQTCPQRFAGGGERPTFRSIARRIRTPHAGISRIRLSGLATVANLGPGVYRLHIRAVPTNGMQPRAVAMGFVVTARA